MLQLPIRQFAQKMLQNLFALSPFEYESQIVIFDGRTNGTQESYPCTKMNGMTIYQNTIEIEYGTMKGAIFDLDGVLVDSHPVHFRAWIRLLRSIGTSVKDHDLTFILEGRKREEILQHFLGELTDGQLEHYGQQKDLFFREECNDIETVSGVREFLQNL